MEDKAMTPDEFKDFLIKIGGADIDTSIIPDAPTPAPTPEPPVGNEDHGPNCAIDNGTYAKARDRQLTITVPLHHFIAIVMGFQHHCFEESMKASLLGIPMAHLDANIAAFEFSNEVHERVYSMIRETDGDDDKQPA